MVGDVVPLPATALERGRVLWRLGWYRFVAPVATVASENVPASIPVLSRLDALAAARLVRDPRWLVTEAERLRIARALELFAREP